MEFEVGARVHLLRDKHFGNLIIVEGTCGTVQEVIAFYRSYVVQLDGDTFPRAILAIDLAKGCLADG